MPGQMITFPKCVLSPRNRSQLCILPDANLALIQRIGGGIIRTSWTSNTSGAANNFPLKLSMRRSGELVGEHCSVSYAGK